MKTSTFSDTIKAWLFKDPALSRAFPMEESPFTGSHAKEMHPLLHVFTFFYGQNPYFRLHSVAGELWLCYDDPKFGLIRLLILGKWHQSTFWTNYTALKEPSHEYMMLHSDKTGCVPGYVPDLFMHNLILCEKVFCEAVNICEKNKEKLPWSSLFWTTSGGSREFHVTLIENVLYSNDSKLNPLRELPRRYKPDDAGNVLSTFSHFLRADISPEVFGMECTPKEKEFWAESTLNYVGQYLDNNGEPYPHDTARLIPHIIAVIESYWLYALASATLKFNILACSFDAEIHMGYSSFGVFSGRNYTVVDTEWINNAGLHVDVLGSKRIEQGKSSLDRVSRRPGKKTQTLLAFRTAVHADYMPITQNYFVPLISYELWRLFGFMDVPMKNASHLDNARFYKLQDRIRIFAIMRETLREGSSDHSKIAATPLMFLEALMYLDYGYNWQFEHFQRTVAQSNPLLEKWVAQEDSLARRIALSSMTGFRTMSAEQIPRAITIEPYIDNVSKNWIHEDDHFTESWDWNRSFLSMGTVLPFSIESYEETCETYYDEHIGDDNGTPYDDDDE